MRRYLKLLSAVNGWQWVHLVTALFVFSYIAFDVLDLDLSNFPLKQATPKRVVVVTEIPRGTKLISMLETHLLRIESWILDPSVFEESDRLQHKTLLRTLRLNDIVQFHRIIHVFSSDSQSSSSPAA